MTKSLRARLALSMVICLLLAAPASIAAQTPQTVQSWAKTFGGIRGDQAYAMQRTADGGYVLVGDTYSYGAGLTDIMVVKTDASGVAQWQQYYGTSNYDYGRAVRQTQDGGFVIAGTHIYTVSGGDPGGGMGGGGMGGGGMGGGGFPPPQPVTDDNAYVIRISSTGVKLWDKSFGSTSTSESGHSIIESADGNVVFSAASNSYPFLVKLNGATGATMWSKAIGPRNYDTPASVKQTADGGFIVAGYAYRNPAYPYNTYCSWLIKTDSLGNVQWRRDFQDPSPFPQNFLNSVEIMVDGSYVAVGRRQVMKNGALDYEGWAVKVTPSGNIDWSKTYGTALMDMFTSVAKTSDGGAVIAGAAPSGGWDAWLIGIDAAGNELWSRTYGGAQMEMVSSVAVAPDGYVIAGQTASSGAGDSDMWLLKAGFQSNLPPVANAGPDRTVEQTSTTGAAVTLNGSASTDPDGDALTYGWSWTGGTAAGVTPTVNLPAGVTTITLTVSDGKAQASDTVVITVKDTVAPQVTAAAGVNPAGKTTPAAESGFLTLTAQDAVDAAPAIYIGTASAPEMYGPFASGVSVKITVAPGAKPQLKQMGGGQSAVSYHIILPEAVYVTAKDLAGNTKTISLP